MTRLRILLLLALLLAIASPAIAQNTLVSATVTDSGGQPWVSGTYSFTSEAYPTIPIISGTLDATGAFSNLTFPTNNITAGVGGRWRVRICPAVTAPCYGTNVVVPGGPTLNLTSALTPPAITIPSLQPQPITAYTDSEIINAVQGNRYFNVTDGFEHVCKALPCASNWAVVGSGGTPSGVEVYADSQAGSDICVKAAAAIATLPSTGGIVRFSAQNYAACAASLTISKNNVTLRGAGKGVSVNGATILNFAAGVTGIIAPGESTIIEGLELISASTGVGTDDGIQLSGGSPVVRQVTVKHFGNRGVVFIGGGGSSTDFWHLEDVNSSNNFGDGFHWAAGCTDNHVGLGTNLSAILNGGWGFNMVCGLDNTLIAPHAAGNTLGGYSVTQNGNYFFDVYAEIGTGSSFVIQPGGATNNQVWFSTFGLPTTITDNSGNAGLNKFHYPATNNVPAENGLYVAPQPGATGAQTYSLSSGVSSNGDFAIGQVGVGFIATYDPTTKWAFPQRVVHSSTSTLPGVNVGPVAGDPSTLVNGDIWYDSTGNKFRCRENGTSTNCIGGGSGSVTNVGLQVNGGSSSGIFAVSGSPVTTTGNLNYNLTGTSGGIPYFSSASILSSSAALTANLPVIGGGAGVAPSVGSRTGNTTQFATWTGATTAARCVDTDANGNLQITAADCGTGAGAHNFLSATHTDTVAASPVLGDLVAGNATPAWAKISGPTTPASVPEILTSTPSGGVAATPSWALAGVPTNPQTGTTYTIAATDRASYLSFLNAGAIAVTLPQAGSAGFTSNFVMVGCDIGVGTATITPTTSTISYTTGTAYTSAASSLALTTGQCAWIYSDNTNYFAIVRSGAGAGITGLTTGFIPKATSSTSVANSLCDEAITTANTLTCTDTAGLAIPSVQTGTTPPACTVGTAGFWCAGEGTEFTNVASTAGLYPDSTQHEYFGKTNGASTKGMMVRVQPGIIHQTAQTAAISTATLCAASAGACNIAGNYTVEWAFTQTGTACTTNTTGGVTFLLTWTDQNGTLHSAQSLSMDDSLSLVATTGTFHFNQTGNGLGTTWATGAFNLSSNGSVIQYATGFSQCSVSGTATYQLDAWVTRKE